MNDKNTGIAALLTDLTEQVRYMKELGVENFDIDLPELGVKISAAAEQNSSHPEAAVSARKPIPIDFQKIIPEKSGVVGGEGEDQPSLPNVPERTKQNRIPSLPKRETNRFQTQPIRSPETSQIEIMSKSEIADPIPRKLDAGDISAPLPDRNETIADIRAEIGECTRCSLCEGRTKIVHSTGNMQAELMFIGEAPGADEDAQGLPFVGRAGQLLTKIIEGINLRRDQVFIGNINRCRPPANRPPTPAETIACRQFILRDIAVIKPKVVVVLGNTACQNLLDTKVGISKLRGNFHDYFGVKVMPTFHPAYLLRDPSKKREVWEDMKKIRDYLANGKA